MKRIVKRVKSLKIDRAELLGKAVDVPKRDIRVGGRFAVASSVAGFVEGQDDVAGGGEGSVGAPEEKRGNVSAFMVAVKLDMVDGNAALGKALLKQKHGFASAEGFELGARGVELGANRGAPVKRS